MKRLWFLVELVFFCVGLALLYWVIRSTDITRLKESIPAFTGAWFLAFLIYPLNCCWDALAWKNCFPAEWRTKISFTQLYLIRLAGEAMNNVTPVLDVGGEPLKILLMRRQMGIPQKTALNACLVGRAALWVGEVVFILMGLASAAFLMPLPAQARWALWVTMGIFAVVSTVFIGLQIRGRFSAELPAFYAREKKRFCLAVFLHGLSWGLGSLEMFFLMRMVGAPVSLEISFLLEALLQLVRTMSFLVPGNLGVQEAGLAFFVDSLGHHAAQGVAVSLLKRVRQIVWTAIGFIVWGAYQIHGSKHTHS